MGLRYRDATVVTVEFRFNGGNALTNGIQPVGSSGAGAGSTSSGVGSSPAGSTFPLLRHYSNPEPDLQDPLALYTHSRNFILILDGAWNQRPGANGIYFPIFRSNKQAMDKTTPKAIKCDRVQAISIHIAGNKTGIGR